MMNLKTIKLLINYMVIYELYFCSSCTLNCKIFKNSDIYALDITLETKLKFKREWSIWWARTIFKMGLRKCYRLHIQL